MTQQGRPIPMYDSGYTKILVGAFHCIIYESEKIHNYP